MEKLSANIYELATKNDINHINCKTDKLIVEEDRTTVNKVTPLMNIVTEYL